MAGSELRPVRTVLNCDQFELPKLKLIFGANNQISMFCTNSKLHQWCKIFTPLKTRGWCEYGPLYGNRVPRSLLLNREELEHPLLPMVHRFVHFNYRRHSVYLASFRHVFLPWPFNSTLNQVFSLFANFGLLIDSLINRVYRIVR